MCECMSCGITRQGKSWSLQWNRRKKVVLLMMMMMMIDWSQAFNLPLKDHSNSLHRGPTRRFLGGIGTKVTREVFGPTRPTTLLYAVGLDDEEDDAGKCGSMSRSVLCFEWYSSMANLICLLGLLSCIMLFFLCICQGYQFQGEGAMMRAIMMMIEKEQKKKWQRVWSKPKQLLS